MNVNDETAAALRSLAVKHETTVTEIVRRAVSVHVFFKRADRAGKRIEMVDHRGNRTHVEMI